MNATAEAVLRRGADLVAGSLMLTLTSPLLAVAALGIRIDSRGPIMYRQQRVGKGGHPFTILKFRTMIDGAEGPLVTSNSDSRITRLGRHLRALKIDELPQFINVVKGDMSLVGPRPEVPLYVDLWPESLKAIVLSVRPGVLDPVTLALRDESSLIGNGRESLQTYAEVLLPMKSRAYAKYVSGRSFWRDIVFLCAAARILVFGTSPGDAEALVILHRIESGEIYATRR